MLPGQHDHKDLGMRNGEEEVAYDEQVMLDGDLGQIVKRRKPKNMRFTPPSSG